MRYLDFFNIELRAVLAVWMRHFTVYKVTWISNFIPPMTEPLFYLFGFGLGLSPMLGQIVYLGHKLDYLPFIAPGMVGVAVLLQAFFEAAYGSFIRLQYQKTWQAIMASPINFTDLFFGELLWASTKGSIAGIITSLVICVCGFAKPGDILLFLPLIFLGSLIFASMGLLSVGLVRKIDEINLPVFLLVVPMSVTAGTYYPRTNLPPLIERVVSTFPLSSLVDLLRYNLVPFASWPAKLLILFIWLFVIIYLAWLVIARKLFK